MFAQSLLAHVRPLPLFRAAFTASPSSNAAHCRVPVLSQALEALGFETRLEERTREGYSIDLMVLTRDGRSIAVEVDGPSHFLEESRTPTGATQLKRRQLRSFGHALVSLPFWEWEALHDKDPSERRRKQRQYLLTALRQRAPCQRKRAKTDVQ
mmetsp:Transcript_32562/g.71432  ORF Transcript_32562/g.71432 Transcript_32562/m.71432 type:complete len:154 (-) Transcript_32562:432-893(-)